MKQIISINALGSAMFTSILLGNIFSLPLRLAPCNDAGSCMGGVLGTLEIIIISTLILCPFITIFYTKLEKNNFWLVQTIGGISFALIALGTIISYMIQ